MTLEKHSHYMKDKEDPEALQEYNWYVEANQKLDKDLREEYEKYHGSLEDSEEYQQALQDKDRDALRAIIFEYAEKVRERKLYWRKQKLIENDRKKEAWKREQAGKAEEEEKQRTKRTKEGEASASAPATQGEKKTYDKENPPRPQREVPIPARDRVPPTPAAQPEIPGLSPRLQLKAENFKNERGQKDDSYYEKKLFDELRQKSYIMHHPTSQHYNSSPEIKRIYEGFVTEDYVERQRKKIKEIQQRGRKEEVPEECLNTTTLLQRLLTMSMHNAPDFSKTIKDQRRDDLRALNWEEAQVRELELSLQGQQLLELYTVLPEKALQ
eukprot:6469679-Amphidinium_carterae.1